MNKNESHNKNFEIKLIEFALISSYLQNNL